MTWVERKMGAGFDPEKFCDYTGLHLWKFPILSGVPNAPAEARQWRMAHWREDGHLRRVRDATAAELAWIAANPAKVQASQTRLDAWLQRIFSNS